MSNGEQGAADSAGKGPVALVRAGLIELETLDSQASSIPAHSAVIDRIRCWIQRHAQKGTESLHPPMTPSTTPAIRRSPSSITIYASISRFRCANDNDTHCPPGCWKEPGMHDNDEDNDGKFPDESPVEVRYPRSKHEERAARAAWPRSGRRVGSGPGPPSGRDLTPPHPRAGGGAPAGAGPAPRPRP